MGGKSKAPPAPDYRGAAEAQSGASERIAQQQTRANRPTQITPWGTSSFTESPGGYWEQNIELSGPQQEALDAQLAIQAGRSGIAQGMLGQAGQEMQTPQDFWQNLPQSGQAPTPPSYGGDLPAQGPLPGPTEAAPFDPRGGRMGGGGPPRAGGDRRVPGSPMRPPGGGMMQGLQPFGAGPEVQDRAQAAYDPSFAQTQFERQMSLQQPQMERATGQLETQLRNQGLTPGTPAYDNAVNDLRNQQGEMTSRMQQDAMRLGADEQQRAFGRELSGGQQRFGQELGAGTYGNQIRGQQFSERQQMLANQGGARQAQFERQLATANLQDRQGQQGFEQELASTNLQDRQRQQQGQEQLAFGGQEFQQQQQQANMQQQLRQQALAEQMQKEGWSLNKINAMLSGQQVGMPQMPNFRGASAGQAPQYLNAANMQGQYGMNAAQMEAGQSNAMMGALGTIGGGMMGGPVGAAIGKSVFGG